jgi:hypothetical protein
LLCDFQFGGISKKLSTPPEQSRFRGSLLTILTRFAHPETKLTLSFGNMMQAIRNTLIASTMISVDLTDIRKAALRDAGFSVSKVRWLPMFALAAASFVNRDA